ncbi:MULTISPECIES: 3-hydroxybutyryl-CoA dehydrogenase [Micromonospora]|uniref:3-hydroxybutyryl-CoA dehydrogenase n=1 Tax=Micromonospora solifontis TaxID=2487138 RepID=A0ABX9WLQ0_9ACTN|nr:MULTISPECIES: 3-hydroxybutyryl-CoA dehydrogenase [Micromonospora]NES15406.1 3-hydroxybutyryl-CoA dehydrogenase [Micromonospora sp. PPF5-17B]NES35848.1 3-hydroxybutyryl-CoA dehydrogenase [Micromonospora solifontis]NES58000.1 3-hydroxybutyryl-CoA dehydrogenase [Micromonospora sp. PPF5-6]RNM00324.1 3-hydroxybutyryl-CoA dehydrogenase [Micromonospora solifontis]
MNTIRRVGVVGGGVMGTGIAEACARAGLDVRVVTSSPLSIGTARNRLRDSLERRLRKGRLTSDERDRIVERVRFGADLETLADRQLVIEAVTERESVKVEVFQTLDKVLSGTDAILASNTSSIPIMRLARLTGRPERVLGLHFFNPVGAMPLVELVGTFLTAERTISQIEDFVTQTLGKQTIRARDRAGFVVNALLVPYLLSAIRMVESGFASAEEIDRGMQLGCNHPMGPLALSDLIGLDTLTAIANALYEEFKEPLYAPPPLLLRMVEGGHLGRKVGRGFRVPG